MGEQKVKMEISESAVPPKEKQYRLSFDSTVSAARDEVVAVFNKYKLPSSVVALICDNVSATATHNMVLKVEEVE